MGEKNAKHGPRLDEQLRRETEGLVRGGGPTRAEPGREPEPVDTDTGRDPTAVGLSRETGTPPGMTRRDVENRSVLAKLLVGTRYPARPDELAAHIAGEGASYGAVRALADLPDDSYGGLPDVLDGLAYGHETRR